MFTAQKHASDPKHSVWVAASAGTGKTRTLTNRVLRLLLDGVPAAKILCLTFTKAAAAEMANRIFEELEQWVILPEEVLQARIAQLHTMPDTALLSRARTLFATVLNIPDGLKIQTIHAFCQMLMRRFPLEANVPPHFQVIDERTAEELLQEAWLRLLTHQHGRKEVTEAAIQHLIWQVQEGKLSSLIKELANQRQRLQQLWEQHGTEGLIENIYTVLGIAQGEHEDIVIERACQEGAFDRSSLQQAAVALMNSPKSTSQERGKQIADWLSLSREQRIDHWDESYKSAFLTDKGEPRKVLTTKDCEGVDDILKREQERVMMVEEHYRSVVIARQTASLLHITEAVLASYDRLKTTQAFLDYQDLILASRRLLRQNDVAPWVLYKLDGGIDHILVDEAQDTSPEQWDVIASLCEEFFAGDTARDSNRTLFVVGDEKQSIFSFQGADPAAFSQMHQYFAGRVQEANKTWHSIALDTSFRSTAAVLQVVDQVFAAEQSRQAITSGLEAISHQPHRIGHAGRVELWPVVQVEDKKDTAAPWELPLTYKSSTSPKKLLADRIAATIRHWLDSKRMLQAKGRPVEPGDILILVRSRKDLTETLIRSLKRANIPVAGSDRLILKDHLAIQDLIALGQFLLLPQDDLTLATVLKSPFIGLSEEQLFELAYEREEQSLWERLKDRRSAQPIYDTAYTFLSELLSKTDYIAPFELYSEVLDVRGGRKKLIARLGKEVNDPIDEFIGQTINYESAHTPSLQGFLQWMAIGETTIKRDMEQGQNEVRVMTVHGSKGLQAPIVFLPDTTAVPSSKNAMVWLEDERVVLWSGSSDSANQFCKEARQRRSAKEYQEYLRLLYVALTRAEDELYVAGYSSSKKVPETSWYALIEQAMGQLGNKQSNDSWVVENLQAVDVPKSRQVVGATHQNLELPQFINTILPKKEESVPIITPSRLMAEEQENLLPVFNQGIVRGKVIHTLFQYLPSILPEQRQSIATDFLAAYAEEFTLLERQRMIDNILQILNNSEFRVLFGQGSRAEVPLVGRVGDHVISGQIDRLAVTETQVWIVDYKTGRVPPKTEKDIPKQYIRQMVLYKTALERIYPGKKIICALLWTENAQLMRLDDTVLMQQPLKCLT